MNDEIVSALLEWNPWLEGEFPESLLGNARDYDITKYVAIPEIKILEGVRRSGKSTLIYQIVQYGLNHRKKVLYVNFDDEILRKYSLSDIYYAYLERGQVDYLLLDEIQHCTEWVPFIRKFYDRKIFEQIWITGSNSSLISQEYAELLTGRNLKIRIHPLSFSEFCRFKDFGSINLPVSKNLESKIKNLFDQYLTLGAFPAIALRPTLQRELLMNYFDDFVYKDIAKRHNINTDKLKDLAIYLATNSAKILSHRKIGTALNLHPNTVTEYISYMQEVFLFDDLFKFDYSLAKQYINEKKNYIVDTGLANAVSFRFSEDLGRILETVVFCALKRNHSQIYFHKDKQECDFIIKEGIEITKAIQVTVSLKDPDTKKRELDGLIDAIQKYELTAGLILTKDESGKIAQKIDGKNYTISIQPIWKWLLEIPTSRSKR